MFSERELATVLASLRHWQEALAFYGPDLADGFPQFHDVPPLSGGEIEELCQRLNTGGVLPRDLPA